MANETECGKHAPNIMRWVTIWQHVIRPFDVWFIDSVYAVRGRVQCILMGKDDDANALKLNVRDEWFGTSFGSSGFLRLYIIQKCGAFVSGLSYYLNYTWLIGMHTLVWKIHNALLKVWHLCVKFMSCPPRSWSSSLNMVVRLVG